MQGLYYCPSGSAGWVGEGSGEIEVYSAVRGLLVGCPDHWPLRFYPPPLHRPLTLMF